MKKRNWVSGTDRVESLGEFDPSLPVAGFDFDSTLSPYRGRGAPVELTLKFLETISAAYNIVIISNRSCLSPKSVDIVKDYVDALDKRVKQKATVLQLLSKVMSVCKPSTFGWRYYVANVCGRRTPASAFYCGDAAGRLHDHSGTDYMFALNCNIEFVTAEAIFGKFWSKTCIEACGPLWAEQFMLPEIPEELLPDPNRSMAFTLKTALSGRKKVVVLMVGSPASGKTHLARAVGAQPALWRRGFVDVPEFDILSVSRDCHGSNWRSAFEAALKLDKVIIVDNTNPLAKDRYDLVRAAQVYGYSAIICHVITSKEACFYLNWSRAQSEPKNVPKIALLTYWSRLQAPAEQEAQTLGAALLRVPFSNNGDVDSRQYWPLK